MPFLCAECAFQVLNQSPDVEAAVKAAPIKAGKYAIVNGYSVCEQHFHGHIQNIVLQRAQQRATQAAAAAPAEVPADPFEEEE